jgi:hypothetical protein
MRRTLFALALVLLPHLMAGAARADVAPFPWMRPQRPWERFAPPSPPAVQLTVEVDARAKATRLLIPRKLLPTLRTASLGNERRERQAWGGIPVWATALTLSLAVGCCGLSLSRPRRICAAAVPLLLAALLLMGREEAFAKQPLPPLPNFALTGQVVVEVVEEGSAVRLILDKNHTWPTRFGP